MKSPPNGAMQSPFDPATQTVADDAQRRRPPGRSRLSKPPKPPKPAESAPMKLPPAVLVLRDLLPALAIVVVVAVVMSRRDAISQLHGKLPMLLGVGVVGALIGLAFERFVLSPPPDTRSPEAATSGTVPYPATQFGAPPKSMGAEHQFLPQPPLEPPPAKQPDVTSAPMLAAISDNNSSMTWNLSGIELSTPAVVSVAKLGSKPEENEDSFALDLHRGRFVVSDGASSSFASSAWSKALCGAFLAVDEPWATVPRMKATIDAAANEWTRGVTAVGETPWWAQEGLRKGAFATLLIVELRVANGNARWRAVAIGDSCLFHLRLQQGQWALVTSFPIGIGEKFDSYPDLVQSNDPQQIEGLKTAQGDFLAQDILILATDAVSEWMLEAPENTWFVASSTEQQIAERFVVLREANEMVNDDATVVRLKRPLR